MNASLNRPMHVERTGDPAVLRWVLHHHALSAAPSGHRHVPPDTPLGRLIADGSITDVAIRGGDALIRAAEPTRWSTVAPEVQAALLVALDQLDEGRAAWLLDADDTSDIASIAEIQAIVDRSAAVPMAAHGGAMIVTAVDATAVHLRAQGACHGCHQSDETLVALIAPAVRAAYPSIVEIVLDPEPDNPQPGASTSRRVLAPRRVASPQDRRACH